MKQIIRILIIEDELVNAQRLQRMLQKIRPDFEVLDILSSISQSVKWLSEQQAPDLIFMDIRLSDGSSFEIFNLMKVSSPIIFTTAYDEYAVKAFKFNSIDYLLKPVDQKELEAAIVKYEHRNSFQPKEAVLFKNLMSYLDKQAYRTKFLLPYRDGFKQLAVGDIAYFYSEFGATFAMATNGEKSAIAQTLETLDQELDPKFFFRANRQYIIHIDALKSVHNYFNGKLKLEIFHGKAINSIIVSRLKASALKEWLGY